MNFFYNLFMKRIAFITLLLLLSIIIFAESQPQQLIKRTVLILPFLNKNNVEKYNYLQDTLVDALNSELIRTDQFNFIRPTEAEEILEQEDIDYYEKTKNLIDIAIKLKADVIVIGQYIIIEDKIMIQVKAIDVFSEQIAASSNINGDLGIDIFRIIIESSKDIANKMAKELRMVDKTYFDEMSKILNQDTTNKEISIDFKKQLSPMKKSGIALISTGGSILLIGIPILIYDLAGYSSIMIDKRNLANEKDIDYSEYMETFLIFTGLLVGSVTASVIGLSVLIVGIPLTVYKGKNKLSINISCNFNNSVDLFFKLRI